ncbi:MAG: DEAD/DEAH box helicase [Sphaerochaetaceae bacterium]
MVLELRPYQQDAIDAFWAFVSSGGRSGVISAPTGSGKSMIIADICRTMCTRWKTTRVIVCTHKYELIRQNEAELKAYYPEADTGIFSAGFGRRDTDKRVIFAGIQTIYDKIEKLEKTDLLIIDEAHLVNTKDGTQYAQFIADLKLANPHILILGLSATPYRLDNGLLYEGEDRLFSALIYDISLRRLIEDGYLSPVISKGGVHKIDLEAVKLTAGDYNKKDLEHAADQESLIRDAVNEIVTYGADRRAWLVFAAGVKHGKHIKAEIEKHGITCDIVTGQTPKDERTRILEDYKAHKIQCLVNVEILVAGFNAPCVDLIALMMATKSTSKYVQAVGRGTRICDNKLNCLLLDYGGNVERHGVLDEVTPSTAKKGKGEGEAPAKECPQCQEIIHASLRVCPMCGHEFPPPAPQHTGIGYDGAVLSSQEKGKWCELSDPPEYSRWKGKEGKPDTIRADFHVFDTSRKYPYSMWLAFDHGGFAAKKARAYARMCGGKAETVAEALRECLDWYNPTSILVEKDPKNPKYWRVVDFDFPVDRSEQQVLYT